MHCERSEHCDLGYRHFGPCPPPPSEVDTQPEIPAVFSKERPEETPGKIIPDADNV